MGGHLQAVPEPGHGGPDGGAQLGNVLRLVPNLAHRGCKEIGKLSLQGVQGDAGVQEVTGLRQPAPRRPRPP